MLECVDVGKGDCTLVRCNSLVEARKSESPPCRKKRDKGGHPAVTVALAHFLVPRFQILLHHGHELVGDGAIDQAVIVAEGEVNDRTDGNRVSAVFVGNHHGLLGDAAYAHDRGVGLVDDRQAEDGAELAGIGDGEGGTFDVFGLEFLGASALAKVGDAALQAEEVEIAGVFEDGDDESPVERDGDSHVDLAMIANVVTFDGGVDDGPLLQCHDCGANEKRHEGETRTVALLESVLVLCADVNDASEIHFVHTVNVRAGAAGLDHVLGD